MIADPGVAGGRGAARFDALQAGGGIARRARQHGQAAPAQAHLRLHAAAGAGEDARRLGEALDQPGHVREMALRGVHQDQADGGGIGLRRRGRLRRGPA